MGDVWLLGMVGAFLGWTGALFTLFVGSIFGTIGAVAIAVSGGHPQPSRGPVLGAVAEVMTNVAAAEAAPRFLQTEIPFGPFLALAAGIFALFQSVLTYW
jgi:prepilin signal peptidase PulO-like enzyme (type II secretory pathway)